jgi:HK97 family phage portal protein
MMQGHLALRGNAYSEITYTGNGQVQELVPINPDRVRIELLPEIDSFRWIVKDPNGGERTVRKDSMFHLMGLSSDGLLGLNPIAVERENIGEALGSQQYGSTFYANGATMPGWIEKQNVFKDDEARANFRNSWQASQTGNNKHKTPVLENGMKYHQLGITHTDQQYLEMRRFKIEDIARMFRVPAVLLQHEGKTQTYGSAEQFFLAFVKFTMAPWYVRWEQAITRDLIVNDDVFFAEFMVDGLLRGDTTARKELYHSGITDGWLTRNEVRQSENRNPLEGLDEPLVPLNLGPADELGDDDDDTDQGDTGDDSRADAIHRSTAKRLANQEITACRKFYDKGLKYGEAVFIDDVASFYGGQASKISESLIIPEPIARAYCDKCVAEVKAATDLEVETSHPSVVDLLIEWQVKKADELLLLEE